MANSKRDENSVPTLIGVSSADGTTPTDLEVNPITGELLVAPGSRNIALQLDYQLGSNPIYIGMAPPGTLTSAALWQIRKLAFDGNDNVTSIKYANGSPNFDQVYDDRAGLTYV